MTNINHEFIGRLAMEYYIADCERFNAKKQRATARKEHLCEGEFYDSERDEVRPLLCHWSGQKLSDWCDNCKYVQPFHLEYMDTVKKARIAKYKLTHYSKLMLWNEGH